LLLLIILFCIWDDYDNKNNEKEKEIEFEVICLNIIGVLIIGSISPSNPAFSAIEKLMLISWFIVK
jgi:hypothetical protein